MIQMNNLIYISRDKGNRLKIPGFIEEFYLKPCYKSKKETVLKSEDVIMSLRKKYLILNIISNESSVITNVRNYFL